MTQSNIDEMLFSESISSPDIDFSINSDIKSIKDQESELKNKRYQSDTTWRCRLSWWVILVDSVWLIAIICILTLNAHLFLLSDTVLIMLLGTTTINVLGLAFIVLKGLFTAT